MHSLKRFRTTSQKCDSRQSWPLVLGAGWLAPLPALIARLKDKEAQVAHYADLALWHIDSAAAVKACGWRPFTSTKWNFTAAFPALPKEEQKPFSWGNQSTMIHTFLIERNRTSYAVAVS